MPILSTQSPDVEGRTRDDPWLECPNQLWRRPVPPDEAAATLCHGDLPMGNVTRGPVAPRAVSVRDPRAMSRSAQEAA